MRNWGKAITLLLVAFFLTFALLIPSMANAQTTSQYSGRSFMSNSPVSFTLTMNSPTDQDTYSNKMILDFTINWTAAPELLPIDNWTFDEKCAYSIDENSAIAVPPNSSFIAIPFPWSYWFSTSVDISNLTNGYHKISILALMYFGPNTLFNQSSIPVAFLVQNPTHNSTPTPAVPEFPTLILIIIFLLTTTLLATIMIERKQSIGWII